MTHLSLTTFGVVFFEYSGVLGCKDSHHLFETDVSKVTYFASHDVITNVTESFELCDLGILIIFFILFETNVHRTLLIFGEGGITSSSDSVSDDDEDDDNDDVSSSESISKKASASVAV